MNSNTQRRIVMTLALAAGLAAPAAACPPDEQGGSPDPAQGVLIKQLPGGGTVVIRGGGAPGRATALADHLAVIGGPQQATLETRFYQPGEAAVAYGVQPATGANTVRVIRVVKDGHDVRVEQRGEKISAKLDGKDVPASDVTVKDGSIEVRDAQGNTVLREEWPEIEVLPATPRHGLGGVTIPAVPPGITWTGPVEEEAPKVMLGITMENADEDAVEQLGLPKGEYAEIATVPEGLPAAKAGLKPKDIVVSIDGKSPASIETIREVIKSKKPGDTVSVEVVRKGTRSKMSVALEAFDARKFRAYGQAMGQSTQQWQQFSEKMAKEMAERAKELSGTFKDRADMDALRDRLKWAIPRGENGEPMILMERMSGDRKQLEERLNALEGQLSRIEEALRRLESRGDGTPAPSGGGGAPKPAYSCNL